jgi:hypothetical protein
MKTAAAVRVLVLIAWCLPALGCKTLGGGGGGMVAHLVDCASQSIRERGLTYVGRLNDVLGNTQLSDTDARGRLIDLGIDAGQDVLGCLLRDQGAKFGESARRNPGDRVSATAARRADARLSELVAEGWRFQ